MAFLIDADYRTRIKDNVLADIINDDTSIRVNAELTAQAEMESYLNMRFDVAAIFSQTGTDRDHNIVMIMVDIVLYHIYSRLASVQVPENRMDRYNDAKRWLEWVSQGKLSPNLPKVLDGEGQDTKNTVIYGSEDKRNPYY